MSLSPRARTILSRFPRHLALDAPGTLFSEVVEALAGHLDRQFAALGRVRSAHRLGQAGELRDLLGLLALHGLRDDLLEPCQRRLAGVTRLARDLAGAADDDTRTQVLARLPDLLAVAAEPWPALAGEDAAATLARTATTLTELGRYGAALEQQRRVMVDLIGVQRGGNGSAGALLHGAAALLGLRPGSLRRSGDDYWHVLQAQDGLRPPGAPSPRPDLLALEENPEADMAIEPAPRSHRELFGVQRLGFGPVPTDVIMVARDDRCAWPMLVDVQAGRALVFGAALGAGQVLRFGASGLVELDGVASDTLAFVIDGGLYADADASRQDDFVFGDDAAADDAISDRLARFGVCHPLAASAALDDGGLPHGGGLLPALHLRVGLTTLRFFVREASFGSQTEGIDSPAVPLFAAGMFDSALAADAAGAPAADIGFAWRERQPYTCQLWLPRRFAALDGPGQIEIRERVRLALERFRPAGVYLGVAYADDRWTLGDGVLRDADSAEPDGLIVHGTRLASPEVIAA